MKSSVLKNGSNDEESEDLDDEIEEITFIDEDP